MIVRYTHKGIAAIWTDEAKLSRWDTVELAVAAVRADIDPSARRSFYAIQTALESHPTDITWWLARDEEVGHDLNAYLDERRRHIPLEHQWLLHKDMTSFDCEEPAFVLALQQSCSVIDQGLKPLSEALEGLARMYQFLVMFERTHGQGAKLRSFGGKVITWIASLRVALAQYEQAKRWLQFSRISGATGNYGGGLTPEIEEKALASLGLKPFYGATQITPRVVYAPLAQSLRLIAEELNKVAHDIRLGARSGTPVYHEPFGKKQKGSSAMPHKKNPILCEQMEGMLRLVRAYEQALVAGIQTWEGRSIEQSSVERVAWPDLFHVIMRMLTVTKKVVSGLVVYPDNMMREIVEARGTYASDEAKNFLAEEFAKLGIGAEAAYGALQLASFCALTPRDMWKEVRAQTWTTHAQVDALLQKASEYVPDRILPDIAAILKTGGLYPVAELGVLEETIHEWNARLRDVFRDEEVVARWYELFTPSHLLRNEAFLFEKILGE